MIRSAHRSRSRLPGGGEPCVRTRIAGVDALVARPHGGLGPVVVYANAATPHGRRRAGGRAPPRRARERRLRRRRAGAPARAPWRGDARDDRRPRRGRERIGPRVALMGASTGAGLAILAAGRSAHRRPRDGGRVRSRRSRACAKVLRLGTTGTTEMRRSRPRRSSRRRRRARSRPRRRTTRRCPRSSRTSDPARFDALYAALAPSTRALVEELSPLTRIADVLAPVELALLARRPVLPGRGVARAGAAGRDVRLTVTPALDARGRAYGPASCAYALPRPNASPRARRAERRVRSTLPGA